jgi:hypothetical protein
MTPRQPSEHVAPREIYAAGYHPVSVDFFPQRRAATHAGFCLPYVRPGTRVLGSRVRAHHGLRLIRLLDDYTRGDPAQCQFSGAPG